MLRLRVDELRIEKGLTIRQLSELTGIRWNTVDDYCKNKAKQWSPLHLEEFMKVFGLNTVGDLIETVEDEKLLEQE